MGNICRTCGGECVLVRDDGEVKEYRCVCCDNIYLVRRGEQFPSFEERRAAKPAFAKPAPQAGGGDAALPRAVNRDTRADRAAPEETGGGRLDGADVYAKCINSVIEVRARRKNTIFSGSGFVIEGGYAITNAHVVAEGGTPAERIEAYACGKTFTAVIVEVGTKKFGDDLALLKLAGAPAELKAVKFAEEDEIKNGQTLFVIGNSLGGGTCITSGIVSDRRRTLEGKPRLMTDCAVNRGNSGGPVFDAYGCVVGTIVSVTTTAEGMNYAIPADVVKKFISRTEI